MRAHMVVMNWRPPVHVAVFVCHYSCVRECGWIRVHSFVCGMSVVPIVVGSAFGLSCMSALVSAQC